MFINNRGEKIYYLNRSPGRRLINVYMAGQTEPNPDYRIYHNTGYSHRWDHYVFEYVLSGKGYIEDQNGTHEVCEGDFYFLNKLRRHIYYADAKNPYSKIFVVFYGLLADRLISAYGMSDSLLIKHCDVKNELNAVCRELDGEPDDAVFDDVALRLHRIIQKVADRPELSLNPHKTVFADAVRGYLDSNLLSDISLGEVAKYFYVSEAHIINTFRRKFGVTPMRYVRQRRTETAAYLLGTTEMSIKELSELLHFSDSRAFAKSFAQIMSVPPTVYREQMRVRENTKSTDSTQDKA